MANPAELLHEKLTRWRANASHHADPAEQRIAVRHLDAIEELLDQMDDAKIKTTLYRQYFDKWVALTLHNPQGWQNQKNLKHIDDSALENLEHLADRLDNGLVLKLQDGGLDALRAYSSDVRALLDEDESIPPLLRQHVKQVIAHLDWCIDNYAAVGEFHLQDAVERLIAAMIRATAASKRKDRWRDKLNTVAWPFVGNVAAQIAAAVPTQLAIQAMLGG
jgi:hypothetical protein